MSPGTMLSAYINQMHFINTYAKTQLEGGGGGNLYILLLSALNKQKAKIWYSSIRPGRGGHESHPKKNPSKYEIWSSQHLSQFIYAMLTHFSPKQISAQDVPYSADKKSFSTRCLYCLENGKCILPPLECIGCFSLQTVQASTKSLSAS